MFLRSLKVQLCTLRRFRQAFHRLDGYGLASLALGLSCSLSLPLSSPARAERGFSPGQKAEIEAIIKDYLLQKPEILREAIGVLEAREKAAETKARQEIVGDPSGVLFSGAKQAVIGNPNGKVTLMEFFDYNCGYCKRALNDLARLMKQNPDLRVVLRDLPILSPGSVEAAKIANAARLQFYGRQILGVSPKTSRLARSRRQGGSACRRQGDSAPIWTVGQGCRRAWHNRGHRGIGQTRQIASGDGHAHLCDRR